MAIMLAGLGLLGLLVLLLEVALRPLLWYRHLALSGRRGFVRSRAGGVSRVSRNP